MTLVYDSSGVASQLGADLQQFSSNGWAPAGTAQDKGRTFYDGGQNVNGLGSPVSAYAANYMDLIVYQGSLYVAWVEYQWNGSVRLDRGPYVAKWNGAAWVAVGSGEVDPSITPVDNTYPSAGYGSFEITDPVGTRMRPARPRLVSDGTSLFCVYTVNEVAVAPPSAYLGPNGANGPNGAVGGGAIIGVTHPFNKWAPRKIYVRKWSGTSWDLYGSLDAVTNNNGCGSGAPPGNHLGPTQTNPGGSAIPGTFLDIGACASPSAPGVVYVAVAEEGPNSPINYYQSGGSDFFAPNRCSVRTAKFDGSSTIGTVQTIIDNSSQVAFTTTLSLSFGGGQRIGSTGDWSVVCKNEDGGMLWWLRSTPLAYVMTAIDTNIDVVVDSSTISSSPYLAVYEAPRAKYLAQKHDGKVEVNPDGSGGYSIPPSRWNGDNAATISMAMFAEGGLDDLNVWTIRTTDLFNTADVTLYHHNCFAMTSEQYPTASATNEVTVGNPALAVIGDTLYCATAVRDPTNTALDLKMRVYSMAISRGAGGSCAGNSPALTGSGSGACSTASAAGTVNPNNAFGGVTVNFEWGLTTAYGNTVAVGTITGGSQAVSASISGLTPGATYHFRVNVIAPDGTIVHGSDASFTEGACAPGAYLHGYIELGASG